MVILKFSRFSQNVKLYMWYTGFSREKKNSTIKSRLKVRGSTAEVKLIYIDRIDLHSSN